MYEDDNFDGAWMPGGNIISDAGATALADAILKTRTLEEIDLSGASWKTQRSGIDTCRAVHKPLITQGVYNR
jgi:hypothetical protein